RSVDDARDVAVWYAEDGGDDETWLGFGTDFAGDTADRSFVGALLAAGLIVDPGGAGERTVNLAGSGFFFGDVANAVHLELPAGTNLVRWGVSGAYGALSWPTRTADRSLVLPD